MTTTTIKFKSKSEKQLSTESYDYVTTSAPCNAELVIYWGNPEITVDGIEYIPSDGRTIQFPYPNGKENKLVVKSREVKTSETEETRTRSVYNTEDRGKDRMFGSSTVIRKVWVRDEEYTVTVYTHEFTIEVEFADGEKPLCDTQFKTKVEGELKAILNDADSLFDILIDYDEQFNIKVTRISQQEMKKYSKLLKFFSPADYAEAEWLVAVAKAASNNFPVTGDDYDTARELTWKFQSFFE